jgi:hypothetical protein
VSSAIQTPKRWFLLAALVGAAVAGTLLLLSAPGQAHRTGPPTNECISAAEGINDKGWGDVCWEAEGDEIWVRDQDRNHWSVRVQLQTSEREIRWCANTHRADSWHQCDFDFPEHFGDADKGEEVFGSCVRWRMFEQNDVGHTRNWTRWSDWYDVEWIYSRCEWVRPQV